MGFRLAAGLFILGTLSISLGCSESPRPQSVWVADEKEQPKEEPKIDEGPRLAFDFDPMMRFGLTVIKDAYGDSLNKRLTFASNGATNSTLLKIDNNYFEFGGPEGMWAPKEERFPNGCRSTWALSNSSIMVRQVLKIVLSEQPVSVAKGVRQRILDTCMIRYEIQNVGTRDHSVGLRMVVDTLIGSNDGVPFAVPTMGGLIDTCKDFHGAEVPDFIQALEVHDLKDPGTIAHMTLRAADLETPSRVILTLWPGYSPFFSRKWHVPLEPMRQQKLLHIGSQLAQENLSDSCVALYWQDQPLKPGEKRVVGVAYGLGRLSPSDPAGNLALTWNGSFRAGQEFSISAYVRNPIERQTLTLELQPGLELVGGQPTEYVPLPVAGEKGDTSVVTWKIKSVYAGKHAVIVRSSTGVVQSHDVIIRSTS